MTLCDLLGVHSTQIPVVNRHLVHVGWQCCGCAAKSGPDGLFPPPAGLRCVTCGGPLPDAEHGIPGIRWENERGLSFCSRACWREPGEGVTFCVECADEVPDKRVKDCPICDDAFCPRCYRAHIIECAASEATGA